MTLAECAFEVLIQALYTTLSDSLKQAGNRCVGELLDGAGNRVSGFCRWYAAGP